MLKISIEKGTDENLIGAFPFLRFSISGSIGDVKGRTGILLLDGVHTFLSLGGLGFKCRVEAQLRPGDLLTMFHEERMFTVLILSARSDIVRSIADCVLSRQNRFFLLDCYADVYANFSDNEYGQVYSELEFEALNLYFNAYIALLKRSMLEDDYTTPFTQMRVNYRRTFTYGECGHLVAGLTSDLKAFTSLSIQVMLRDLNGEGLVSSKDRYLASRLVRENNLQLAPTHTKDEYLLTLCWLIQRQAHYPSEQVSLLINIFFPHDRPNLDDPHLFVEQLARRLKYEKDPIFKTTELEVSPKFAFDLHALIEGLSTTMVSVRSRLFGPGDHEVNAEFLVKFFERSSADDESSGIEEKDSDDESGDEVFKILGKQLTQEELEKIFLAVSKSKSSKDVKDARPANKYEKPKPVTPKKQQESKKPEKSEKTTEPKVSFAKSTNDVDDSKRSPKTPPAKHKAEAHKSVSSKEKPKSTQKDEHKSEVADNVQMLDQKPTEKPHPVEISQASANSQTETSGKKALPKKQPMPRDDDGGSIYSGSNFV